MIVESKGRPLDTIIGEMKSDISRMLRKAISDHHEESRREWVTFMMEKAGTQTRHDNEWQRWQQHNKPIEILNRDMVLQNPNYIWEPG